MSPRLLSKAALARRCASLERSLAASRTRLGALEEALAAIRDRGASPARLESGRFVQMFTMNRGPYYAVLMALDAEGTIWERHQNIDKATKTVIDEWWEVVPVTRRGKV